MLVARKFKQATELGVHALGRLLDNRQVLVCFVRVSRPIDLYCQYVQKPRIVVIWSGWLLQGCRN
jgi:hypothetical protein